MLDDRVPFHDRGSGDPRMAKMLYELVDLWPDARVTLAAADGREVERYAEPLLARGIEVVAPPVDWERWFENRMFHYSVAIVSRGSNVTRFGELLRRTQPQALRVFDTEALTFRRLERMVGFLEDSAAVAQARAEANAVRQVELGALHESTVVFAVSEEEAEFIAEVAAGVRRPSCSRTGSSPFEARSASGSGVPALLRGLPRRSGIAERGRAPAPRLGRDADLWERDPELRLHVVGADPTPAVEALQSDRVNVVGYVEDPAEWLSRTRVHVSPMRFGSGIKLKLLDTIAAGQPFVTTAVGAEGLPLGELASAIVAEEPEVMPSSCTPSTRTSVLWRRRARAARHRAVSLRPRHVQADAGRGDEPSRRAPAGRSIRRSRAQLAAAGG